jgi:hypothetical protein
MSADNEALARSFFEQADRGRTPVELCTAGFTAHFPGPPPMDLEGFDHRFEGTHTGDFMGVPASGKQFSVGGTAFLHVAGGKVAQLWGFLDQLGLMQQIGGRPAPAQAG